MRISDRVHSDFNVQQVGLDCQKKCLFWAPPHKPSVSQPERCLSPVQSAANLARDYFDEVVSCVEVALPNWCVKHLSIWSELVQPQALNLDVPDVEEIEETTQQCQFQEIRSKLALLDLFQCYYIYYCLFLVSQNDKSTTKCFRVDPQLCG